ncbi:MAG: DUF1761 domain-containing protein [Bacteroidota bacterium]
MENLLTGLNLWAILLAGAAYFILGGLWFAQFTFGKIWDTAIGFDRPDTWKETPIYFIGPFLGSLAAATVMAILLNVTHATTLSQALQLGLLTGFGFAASVSFTNAITPTMKQPLTYGLITGAYHIIGIALCGLILQLM